MIKYIEITIPFYVTKAAWMGVGSQTKTPTKGKWHSWITESFLFMNRIHFS